MEQVFKTKRARRWWIIIVSLVVLIIFLNVYLEQSWAFSALGGIIISVLMFYSQSKTIYIVKDNGVLEIKPGWGNRICVDGIRKVSYNPNAIGGCSDYFSECVFGAKLGFFGAWGNYYFCINVLFAIENHLYCKRQWCSGN
jgi:hypothetical protein